MKKLQAGAAIIDVTPKKPMFLYGYPHVERISQGVHDPLYASALIINNSQIQIGFCAVDVIYISREITDRVRERVHQATGIPGKNFMISASHTHSGPVIVNDAFNDPVVPKADPKYISYLVDRLVQVYMEAFRNQKECEIAITVTDGSGVGGNRRMKTDATDPDVPIIALKDTEKNRIFALSTIYCMHPTVLHEDSKLYSADFPGYTRAYIRKKLGDNVVLLYHTGPAGNQSTRHFIKSNTFDEAKRMGYMLGERITDCIHRLENIHFKEWVPISARHAKVTLPKKSFMPHEVAEEKVTLLKNKLKQMRLDKAPVSEIRTIEVDWFGAEENKQLAEIAASGEMERIYQSVLPAEIDVIGIGDTQFIFLPGELFVEYSLTIKEKSPVKSYVTSLSNGVLAGYLVTEEAEQEGGYEAFNSVFPAKSGQVMVDKALALLDSNITNLKG